MQMLTSLLGGKAPDSVENSTNNSTKNSNVSLHSSLRGNFKQSENMNLNQSWGPSYKIEQSKQDEKQVHVSLYSKLKNWATNFHYRVDNKFHDKQEGLIIPMLGRRYTFDQEEEINKCIRETIWFSYRENIPPIMKDKFPKDYYTCDRGWGCMLRCGQMMLAEALKRHLYTEDDNVSKEALLDIILMFADCVQDEQISPFSIHQICAKAFDYFDLKPGQWFKPSNIMVTLSKLNEQYSHPKLKNFSTCLFVDGTVFEDQIFEKIFGKKEKPETNHKKEHNTSKEDDIKHQDQNNKNDGIFNEEEKKIEDSNSISHEKKEENIGDENSKEQHKINDKWNKSLLIFIATKTGLDEHNELYLHTILKLLSFKHSIGMLSGKGSRAYYFIGSQNNNLLYFDPHYVQETSQNIDSLYKDYNTYFLDKSFQINVRNIDTSVGFGFYIRDEKDYLEFKNELLGAMKEDPNFLVGFEDETPSLDLDPEDVVVCREDNSFEVIE